MTHLAILILREKASVFTPFHAGTERAVASSFRTDSHVTPRVGSTDAATAFLSWDQKYINLVRVST